MSSATTESTIICEFSLIVCALCRLYRMPVTVTMLNWTGVCVPASGSLCAVPGAGAAAAAVVSLSCALEGFMADGAGCACAGCRHMATALAISVIATESLVAGLTEISP